MLDQIRPHSLEADFPDRDEANTYRIYRTSAEGASVAISDSGNFTMLGLVEGPSRPLANPHEFTAIVRMCLGWSFVLFGAVILGLFILPSTAWNALQSRTLPGWIIVVDPVLIGLTYWTGSRALAIGRRMIDDGEKLLQTYWFEAPSLFYEFHGATSKDEIGIGTSIDDSLRTTSSVTKSQLTARFVSASLVAEIPSIQGERAIFAMNPDENSRTLGREAAQALQKLAAVRHAPTAIDLTHSGVEDVLKANIAVKQAKLAAENLVARDAPRDRLISDDRVSETRKLLPGTE